MRHLSLGRLLAAAALVAAAVGVGVPAPATAAGCSSADGVTVVVDFNELGGGVRTVCDAGGGGQKASALFPDNGYPLSYASRQPGFVCRVSGVPASDPCVNTAPSDAYWGLWWSDGKSGSWSYSSLGAGSLTIPDGGYVGFSWDQGAGDAKPGYTPAAHPSASPSPTPAPTPTATPSSSPGGQGGQGGQGGGQTGGQTGGTQQGGGSDPSPGSTTAPGDPADPSASATPSVSPTATGSASGSATPPGSATPDASGSASPSETASDSASPELEPIGGAVSPTAADADDDGLPSYVAPLLIVVLFAVAGGVFLVRRRQGSP